MDRAIVQRWYVARSREARRRRPRVKARVRPEYRRQALANLRDFGADKQRAEDVMDCQLAGKSGPW